jgi:LSD1 subclass zinc finger protein
MRQVKCPDCRALLQLRDGITGNVRCPKCGASIGLEDDIPVVGAEPAKPRAPRPALKHSVSEKPGGGRGPVPPPVVGPADESRRRPRREEPRSTGPNVLLLVLGLVAAVLLLVCGGGGIIGYVVWDRASSGGKNVTLAPVTSRSPGPVFAPPGFAPDGPPPGMPPDFRKRMDDAMRGMPDGFLGGDNAKPVKLPALPPAIPIGVAPLPGDKHAIDLPDRVVRVASAGGGRFMVFAFANEKKVGVFDLNDLKINYVDLPESDVWVAGAMNRFAVYLPAAKKLRRYNLLDRKQEKERACDPEAEITSFAMGSASNGPLLLVAGQPLSRMCRFFDLDNLEPMNIPAKDFLSRLEDAQDLYWPAANGRYFGCCWSNDGGGLKLSAMSIEAGIMERIDGHTHTWFVAPFADGKYVATGGGGILSRDLKSVNDVPFSAEQGINLTYMFVPAQSGPYYMHVQTGGTRPGQDGGIDNKAGTIVFYALGSRNPLRTLNDVPVPVNEWPDRQELRDYQSITLPRGVQFSPEAKALIIIPPSRDKLHLYRVDLKKKN